MYTSRIYQVLMSGFIRHGPFGNKLAPVQCACSNDCGVYLCFFMELLMHGMLPELLIGLEQEVTKQGRDALWSAIQANQTFFSMFTTPYLHLFMNEDIAYIEELAFHYQVRQASRNKKRSLPKPQEFSLIPPNLMAVPNGAMIIKRVWSLLIFQG